MKRIRHMTCNGLEHPLGIDRKQICFSWQIETDQKNIYQVSYQLRLWQEDGSLLWDSGRRASDQCLYVPYEGEALKEKSRYHYQVTVEDNRGEVIRSARHSLETGIEPGSFQGKWIGRQIPLDKEPGPDTEADLGQILVDMMQGREVSFTPDRKLESCNRFERCIVLEDISSVRRARIYMTARGIYELRMNGELTDDSMFAPGFTNYHKELEYQVYDVTELLHGGENRISVVLADGWYKGKFGMLGLGENYGDELSFLMDLEIVYEDESRQVIGSDEAFRYTRSPWLYADILIGEAYDARLETAGEWTQARVVEGPYDILRAPCAEPVRPTQILPVREVLTSPSGETILDFGQNLVGVVELEASGPAGARIMLEYSEVLSREGNFGHFIDGYNRDQTDFYTLKGAYRETYRPRFTFHGFRYVKVSGYPGEIRPEQFRAVAIGSDCAITNQFHTSDHRLNQLQSNLLWSQRGNLLSIPTDCPQRERAGWTGDVWVYGETCCINQDCRNFFRRWLGSLRKEQFEDGLVPIVIPYPKAYSDLQLKSFGTHTSAGWGDVIVALPWYLYEIYGDVSALEENYEAMERWMGYVRREVEDGVKRVNCATHEAVERQKYLWNTNFHFGDWLYPSCKAATGEADMFASANTTKEYVATAIYANSTDLMAKICHVLGKEERSVFYRDLNGKIRKAFAEEYVSQVGTMEKELQGVYVMALAMGLIPEDRKHLTARRLQELIEANGGCLDTGFMSIRFLMDVLADNGLTDVANEILYQEACPSWLYEVKKGATTIWETWNNIREDGERGRFSYNHYAFGCVGSWMYRNLLGLRPLVPGYREVLIAPGVAYGLNHAEGAFDSVYGQIRVSWRKEQEGVRVYAKIPANVTAYAWLSDGTHRTLGNGEFEWVE